MKSKFTLVMMLLTLTTLVMAGIGGHTRKVLVIGIDGCRADALEQANTPNIDSLITKGFFTYDSWHLDITVSGPSWSSIMTGVYHNKHGVTNNNYTGSNYNQYPYFPTHAKQIDSTFKCIQYTEWSPMSAQVYNDGWDRKIVGQDGNTQLTGHDASIQIQDPNVDVLFTYFDKVDLTGHSTGFTPTNPAYIQAIDSIDRQVGLIIAAMRARPTYAQEDWLILLTTDHGGTGLGHGGNSFSERHIWWIGYSDRGIHSQVSGPQNANNTNPEDPGSYNMTPYTVDTAKQHKSPVQVDIAVTALHHLIYGSGIRPENQPAWNLDGRSWLCEMGLCNNKQTGPSSINEVTQQELAVKVVPNPSTNGKITVWCENEDNQPAVYSVSDMSGRIVKSEYFPSTTLKQHLDLSALSKGQYLLSIHSGTKSAVKEITIQ